MTCVDTLSLVIAFESPEELAGISTGDVGGEQRPVSMLCRWWIHQDTLLNVIVLPLGT